MKQVVYRYIILSTILLPTFNLSIAQSDEVSSSAKIDSLQHLVDELSGTQRVDMMNVLAFEWFNYNVEKANEKATEALELSQNLNYAKGKGEALIYKGVYERMLGHVDRSGKYLTEGIKLARKANIKGIEGYGLLQYGSVMLSIGKKDSALLLYKQSYNVLRDSLNPGALSTLYKNLSKYYKLESDLAMERKYLFRSMRIREELKDPKLLILIYAEIASYFNNANKYDESFKYIQKAELLIPSIENSVEGVYEIMEVKAAILIKQSRFEEALKTLVELKEYDKLYSTRQLEVNRLIEVGYLFYDLGNYELSLTNYYEALKIAEENNYPYERAKLLGQIGLVYYELDQGAIAYDFAKRCLWDATTNGYKTEEATSSNLLGLIYGQRNEYDSALKFYQHALELRNQLGDHARVAFTMNNLGDIFVKQGRVQEAVDHFQKAIEIARSSNHDLAMAWSFQKLGHLYYEQRDTKRAFEYIEKAEALSKELPIKRVLLAVFKTKADVYKALNKKDKALEYVEKYAHLKDSISTNSLTTRIAGLQSQYVISEKNQQIELLNKDKALHQSQIREQKTIIIVVFGGVVLLVIAGVVLYRNYKFVTKLNKAIKEQNKKIHIQSEELARSNHSLIRLNEEITKQKDIIQAQADARYRKIFDSALEGIFQSTPEGRFITVNSSMARIFGFDSPEEMISGITNTSEQIYADPRDRQRIQNQIREEGKSHGTVLRALKKNGDAIWIRVNSQAVHDSEGEIKYYEGTLEDITAKINDEIALKNKNDELAKVNGQMERFLYSASHDLRSPISSILGLINVLRLEVKDEITLSYVTKIESSTQKLDKVIRDIVDFSKTNYKANQSEEIDFKTLIDQVLNRYALTESFQYISIEVVIDDEASFYSDNERLEIVMENLIRNSITFFDVRKIKPFIKIHVKTNVESATIEIRDNGIGIASNHIENIFKMFYRASDRSKGAGLGLFIVKESLQRLNATIEAESESGLGTTFRVYIPNDHQGRVIDRKLQLNQSTHT